MLIPGRYSIICPRLGLFKEGAMPTEVTDSITVCGLVAPEERLMMMGDRITTDRKPKQSVS